VKKKQHIAIVCAHFHPMHHIAAQRMNAFVKYLDQERYMITVLTSTNCAPEGISTFEKASVHYLSGSSIIKLRKQTPGMPRWRHHLYSLNNKLVRFFSKSDLPGWERKVLQKLEDIDLHIPIDFILTTFFPLDAHKIGLQFKRSHPTVIWIADMRDEMGQNKLLSPKEQRSLTLIESEIGNYVDIVTSVSKPILDGFRENMPRKEITFIEVRNGFDHDFSPLGHRNNVFTFCYAGTFYGIRKPDTFFKALLRLKEQGKLPSEWIVRFIGTSRNFSVPSALRKHVEFLGMLPNEEVIHYLQHSDCNLLIHPPTEAKGIFTGKLFDYLSVEQPILALVDVEDVAAELIEECKAGISVDFYSVSNICEAIECLLKRWGNREKFLFETQKIKTLHRHFQVQKLDHVLQELSRKTNVH
jgi:glycosyltransferase involved in cell wall biosynthesis